MAQVVGIDSGLEVFADPRGDGRVLRVHWHPDEGLLVLSIWRGDRCVATSRLATEAMPNLIRVLSEGIAEPATAQPATAQPIGRSEIRQVG